MSGAARGAGGSGVTESLFKDGALVVAKRSKSGRVWKITGRRLGGGVYRELSPQGDNVLGFGGVKRIWKTDAELAKGFEHV